MWVPNPQQPPSAEPGAVPTAPASAEPGAEPTVTTRCRTQRRTHSARLVPNPQQPPGAEPLEPVMAGWVQEPADSAEPSQHSGLQLCRKHLR